MSATMHLYEIAKDVTWIPGPYYDLKPSEITEEMWKKSTDIYHQVCLEADEKFGRNNDSPEKDKWIEDEHDKRDPLYFGHWSDNKDHYTFDFYKCSKKNVGSRSRRPGKYMSKARQLFPEFIQNGHGKYDNRRYLVLNEVFYRQGWFFTDRLFKSKQSIFYAFDKESAIKLVNRLVDTSKEYGSDVKKDIIDKLNAYNNTDNFVFEIAW